MAGKTVVPEFGPLSGVKVVSAALAMAAPFAVMMMADYGADVTWIESPLMPDISRVGPGMLGQQDRRNQKSVSLNIPSPEGREIFLKMLKDADIFVESSKGGQYAKWGLTDEVLWEQNPALVIVHVSGFGQTGIPEHVSRPSYDPIAQAFSGFMSINGFPDRPPIPAAPQVADYITGLFALGSALAALYKAKTTGEGDSIDLAQFEAMARIQCYMVDYMNVPGMTFPREGNRSAMLAGWGGFTCKDGKDLFIAVSGGGGVKNVVEFLGLGYGSEEFPAGSPNVMKGRSKGAAILDQKLEEYCATKTVEEAEKELTAAGVACCTVMDYEMIVNHPHYLARDVFIEWETMQGKKIRGLNVVPKFKKHPGKVWRPMPGMGMDNEEILSDLGLTEEQIQELYEKKVIKKGK
ncbi:L-carnitine CoA-transferase [Dehalobacter sp. DCM]|uniref:L-carnitine CoA-transferase n=1 Tax=Dehalobacter sp. DCM TaxID=2907827 RepID=UPI00308121CD|nr:L-carnitine CoA-transferase [Dehalobacter sp. DCM]